MADFQEKHMHTDVGFTHWSLDNALQLWQWKSSPLFSLWSFLRWYMFERQSYKGRETEIFHLFLHSLNDQSDWGQARQSQEPVTPSISPMCMQGPDTWAIFHCFSWHINRKLDQKWRSRTQISGSRWWQSASQVTAELQHCRFWLLF